MSAPTAIGYDRFYVIKTPENLYFQGMVRREAGDARQPWEFTPDLRRAWRCYSENPIGQLEPTSFIPELFRPYFPAGCRMVEVAAELKEYDHEQG